MPINVSATGLSDFIQCSMKTNFRVNHPQTGVPSEAMAVGSIVHNAIEKHFVDQDASKLYALAEVKKYNFPNLAESSDRALEYLENFFSMNSTGVLITPDSLQEISFKIPVDKSSNLVGRIDCITGQSVFDWKTGSSRKRNLENDIQCIFYSHAVEKLYGFKPQVYLVYLKDSLIVKYNENTLFREILFEEVIPRYIRTVRNQDYIRTGVFNNSCRMCTFRESCIGDN